MTAPRRWRCVSPLVHGVTLGSDRGSVTTGSDRWSAVARGCPMDSAMTFMTKLEICNIEDSNPGQVYLYPEGTFYKAYQKSAWLLQAQTPCIPLCFSVLWLSFYGKMYFQGVLKWINRRLSLVYFLRWPLVCFQEKSILAPLCAVIKNSLTTVECNSILCLLK